MGYEKVKISKIGVLKLSLISGFFGLISGLFSGLIFLIFFRTMASSWGMSDLPTGGLILLAFLGIPLIYFILSFIFASILVLFFNLFLKIIKGLDIQIKNEKSIEKKIKQTKQPDVSEKSPITNSEESSPSAPQPY